MSRRAVSTLAVLAVLVLAGLAAVVFLRDGPSPAAAIEGVWVGCDGREVVFSREGDGYVGRYRRLGGLEAFGFSVDEVGYRARPAGDGRYAGEVLWRWKDGRSEWRANEITVEGDRYADTGSDDCARTMRRPG